MPLNGPLILYADHLQHFVRVGQPFFHENAGIVLQVDHPQLPGGLVNVFRARLGSHHLAQFAAHLHDFVDADAAFHALATATVATFALPELGAGLKAEVAEYIRLFVVLYFATLAEAARQALRHDAHRRSRHQERLDIHLAQTCERTCSRVGVQCGEHHVAGERGFYRDACGLFIARLTDEDDIGILAEEGAQNTREVEPDLLMRLDLHHAGQI